MVNPLVAQRQDSTSPLAGTFLLEDGEQLVGAFNSGSWVSGGMAAFAAVGDAASFIADPIGSLIAMGAGWVLEHVHPLDQWLDEFTGDADQVAAYAQTWGNINTQLSACSQQLAGYTRSDLSSMSGQTISAITVLEADLGKLIEQAGKWASAMGQALNVAATLVQIVHDLVRDALSEIIGELETAGKCLEWVKDHLALDEINVYLDKHSVCEGMEARFRSLYDYMSEVISRSEPGAGGVLFTPWLHGNRCPFEDPNARAMFMNISLNTGKTELMRAVVEGVCYHMRWFIETQEKKVMTSSVVRFVGGGALSDVTAQILADIVGRPVEVTENPQDAGAVGAALLVAVGAGITPTVESARRLVTVHARFEPRRELAQTYARQYDAYRKIYPANKKIFSLLNRG